MAVVDTLGDRCYFQDTYAAFVRSVLSGIRADVARDGEQVFETVSAGNFDIVFMDVQMPVLDGLEATRKIRAADIKQPFIVALTANAMPEDRQACLVAGMDEYISKPLRPIEVKTALEKGYPTSFPV